MATPPRGKVAIDTQECKGCGLCVDACPPKCLTLMEELNPYGVHPARYTGEHCTGCGICFYACPEPGAITVSGFRDFAGGSNWIAVVGAATG